MKLIWLVLFVLLFSINQVSIPSTSVMGFEPNNPNVELFNLITEPRVVYVGDTFRIKASVSNLGSETISYSGICTSPISAKFSSNVRVEYGTVCTAYQETRLEPGETVTVEGINGEFLTAVETGIARANITFNFWAGNLRTNFNVTREFSFEIYQYKLEIPQDVEEQCTVNFVCVTSPEFHDISQRKVSRIIAENQYQIQSTITYGNNKPLEFFYATIIRDELGITVSLLWVKGALEPNQEVSISTSWLPEGKGHYTLRTHFSQPYEVSEPIDPPPGTIWIDTEVGVWPAE